MINSVSKAIDFIKTLDLKNLEVGKYTVDDNFYYMIQEYNTKPVENCRLEAHRNYIDIQWIISGEEQLDTCSLAGLEVDDDYNPEKDVIFYKKPEDSALCESVLTEGSYAVYYPEVAHMPQIAVSAPASVKKLVAKIRFN